jgi:hypothetical protein
MFLVRHSALSAFCAVAAELLLLQFLQSASKVCGGRARLQLLI